MIRSAATLANGTCIESDVCVIGAGPAGLAIANELAGSSTSVCVLESGNRSMPAVPDPMLDVQCTHLAIANDSRVRALGGTTKVWTGGWKAFDDIDFAPRAWVPLSGWPISRDSLDPFYVRASRAAGVELARGEVTTLPLRSDELVATEFRTQPEALRDWGAAFASQLERPANVQVYLDAHVVGLERTRRTISRIRVRHRDREIAVAARRVVVATGGIENARLLLDSEIGNERGQVGRYYMDHPKGKLGIVECYAPLDLAHWKALDKSAGGWVGLRLDDAVQRTREVLNSYVLLAPVFERDLARALVRRLVRPRHCRVFELRNYMEQQPCADNRVFLTPDRDAYGRHRAGVTWTMTELDRRTMVVLHGVLLRELQRCGIGELRSPLLLESPPPFDKLQDASHHMGTTRMGLSPATSVVDTDCKVHGTDNLFVAGSSVFPTSGYANPTATIVALAIRLADHLRAHA